jgi:cadmium resistance transport/sequestration family protein
MLSALLTAIAAFAATNIDDIFVLLLFFCQTGDGLRRWHIVAGQYLGFSGLVLVSLLGFLAGLFVPREWIGLLGLVPVFIGVKKWLNHNKGISNAKTLERTRSSAISAIASVATVTIANGGDNIGIYSPLFANSDLTQLFVTLVVFYLLLGVWCCAGYFLSRHPAIAQIIKRHGHVLVPFVLVGLGVYILIESGTSRLFRYLLSAAFFAVPTLVT